MRPLFRASRPFSHGVAPAVSPANFTAVRFAIVYRRFPFLSLSILLRANVRKGAPSVLVRPLAVPQKSWLRQLR